VGLLAAIRVIAAEETIFDNEESVTFTLESKCRMTPYIHPITKFSRIGVLALSVSTSWLSAVLCSTYGQIVALLSLPLTLMLMASWTLA